MTTFSFYTIVALTLLTMAAMTDASKILIIIPIAGQSQYVLYIALANGLAERGHHVTVITATPGKSEHPNVVVYSQPKPTFEPEMMKEYARNVGDKSTAPEFRVFEFAPEIAEATEPFFNRPEVKKLLQDGRRQFDLAIVDNIMNEWAVSFASMIAHEVMHASSGAAMPWSNPVPTPPSTVPTYFLPISDKMDFFTRFRNALIYAANRVAHYYYELPIQKTILKKYVPNAPEIDDVMKRAHFFIVNQDNVLYSPRPTIPNVVEAGGWHCRGARPVPKEFEDFIQASGDNGFIIFGLGTNIKSEYLDPEIIQNFLKAFARLKQNVIWKFGAKLDNIPKNVKIVDWMPQQDLLGHPKIRLFMSHGGLLSLQETVYHGIPVIGIPVFFDQPGNVHRAVELGLGEPLDLNNITEEGVYQLIQKVMNDKRYSESAKRLSKIARDQPQHPLERAIFWVEYVIRHNGALHLRTAGEDLNFFQYFLLDVIGVVATITSLSLYLIYRLSKCVLCKIFGGKKCNKHENKNKKKRN